MIAEDFKSGGLYSAAAANIAKTAVIMAINAQTGFAFGTPGIVIIHTFGTVGAMRKHKTTVTVESAF